MNNRADGTLPYGSLEVSNLGKSFGSFAVLESIDLSVPSGQFVSIIGKSGCGKSTLLSIIAGLQSTSSGSVQASGSKMMVFQQDGLFPWLNVEKNISLGLRYRKAGKDEISQRTMKAIAQVGLSGFESSFPSQLSGGMRQRTALARALVMDPDILLMDEPFGALDAITRMKMQNDLHHLWDQEKKTVIMVTHDVDEAILLSDRIIVMGAQPGTIVLDVQVSLERPREPGGGGYYDLRERLLVALNLKERHWAPSI